MLLEEPFEADTVVVVVVLRKLCFFSFKSLRVAGG
jgi:hypothetical protein